MDDIFENAPDFIDPEARDLVTVTGPDAASYLHSQLAQDVNDLAVGDTRWTFLLEPTGKVDVLARITRTADDSFVFDTDAGFGETLVERLNRFKLRVDAGIEVRPAAQPSPTAAHEAARIAEAWPRMGAEIVPGETIPATTGVVEQSVSFTKGCYPGQELVERMHSRGAEAPRSLRIIEVDDTAAVGDPVLDGDAEVGTITSVAGPLALAYIKRGSDAGTVPTR